MELTDPEIYSKSLKDIKDILDANVVALVDKIKAEQTSTSSPFETEEEETE